MFCPCGIEETWNSFGMTQLLRLFEDETLHYFWKYFEKRLISFSQYWLILFYFSPFFPPPFWLSGRSTWHVVLSELNLFNSVPAHQAGNPVIGVWRNPIFLISEWCTCTITNSGRTSAWPLVWKQAIKSNLKMAVKSELWSHFNHVLKTEVWFLSSGIWFKNGVIYWLLSYVSIDWVWFFFFF